MAISGFQFALLLLQNKAEHHTVVKAASLKQKHNIIVPTGKVTERRYNINRCGHRLSFHHDTNEIDCKH